jgi:glutaconate CoA-transferase subunit A
MLSLSQLAAAIPDGAHLAIPPDYAAPSMAATRALIARGAKDLRLLAVPTAGIQADLLIGAGCVAALEAAAITLGELGPAPRFSDAIRRGTIRMRDSTCPAVHAALQAAEKGIPFMPLRGIIGSDLLRHRDDWRIARNPFADGDDPIVFLPAIKPAFALFHAPKADREGNVWIGRRRELVTLAHAAARTLVTVEEVVETSLLASESSAAATLPAMYVTDVALAPRGAWPLGCHDLYDADADALAGYARAARSDAGFRDWLAGFLAPAKAA